MAEVCEAVLSIGTWFRCRHNNGWKKIQNNQISRMRKNPQQNHLSHWDPILSFIQYVFLKALSYCNFVCLSMLNLLLNICPLKIAAQNVNLNLSAIWAGQTAQPCSQSWQKRNLRKHMIFCLQCLGKLIDACGLQIYLYIFILSSSFYQSIVSKILLPIVT